MVDDVSKLGELLKLPNLEEDTVKLINAKMRELIGSAQIVKLPELTPDIMDEWLNGKKEGE